nr:response regulator [uncultured Butyricicoccus sp.]
MYNVMLVDNEPAILHALAYSIDWAAQDCRIMATARDGREAMLQFDKQPPDIVISDIRMPEMDGLALAKWIADHYPACKTIILTGFPDFTYAQQAINYRVVDFVLKPTSEEKLIAALNTAKARLAEEQPLHASNSRALEQNLLIHQLIFDPGQSLLYTMQRIHDLGLELSQYYVLRFGVSDSHDDAARIAFLQDVQDMWREVFEEHTLYFVPRAERFCYIVLCADAAFSPTAGCNAVVQTVQQTTDFQITVGISAHHTDPLDLSQAAQQADHAQQMAEYSPQMPVISFSQLPVLSDQHATRITEELRLLQSALENRNRSTVESGLDRLFAYLRREAIPFASVKRIAVILYECGQGLLISYSIESLLADAATPGLSALLEGGDIGNVQHRLHDYLIAVLDRICCNATDLDDLIFQVKQYIDQNYAGELSLEGLAEYVHLSASYLSKLFKRELGQNISNYIQSVRIEHAKVLLRTTSMKTYEIAEAVGIADPVYFSKIFKKATGQKPKDFRAAESP